MKHAGILMGLALVLVLTGLIWFGLAQKPVAFETASAEGERPCVLVDDRTRTILVRGLDQALQEYFENLFHVMLQDKVGGPARAIAGARGAIEAHAKAVELLMKPCI